MLYKFGHIFPHLKETECSLPWVLIYYFFYNIQQMLLANNNIFLFYLLTMILSCNCDYKRTKGF